MTTSSKYSLVLTRLVCACVALAFSGCGPEMLENGELGNEAPSGKIAENRDEIVNGRLVSRSYNPAVVRLKMWHYGGAQSSCTGSLVSARSVITAAHCLKSVQTIEAVFPNGTVRGTRFRYHPNYNPNWHPSAAYAHVGGADIAVVELASDAPTSARIGLNGGYVAAGQYIFLMGYGVTRAGGTPVALPSLGTGQVYQSYMQWFSTTGPTTACNGDSGGPVFDSNWQLLGVISLASVNCDFNYMVQVAAYRNWILNNLF